MLKRSITTALLAVSFCTLSFSDDGIGPGSTAHAEGPGPREPLQPPATKKPRPETAPAVKKKVPKKSATKTETAEKPPAKPSVPRPGDAKSFIPETPGSGHKTVRAVQQDIEDEARRDNLRATTIHLRQVGRLRQSIDDAVFETMGGKARNEPKLIMRQLGAYRDQTQNKELAYNAANLLTALSAERALQRARVLEAEYYRARKAGDKVKTAVIYAEYGEASQDYQDRLGRVSGVRGIFPQRLPRLAR